jgi:hypothetical protein
MRQVDPGVREGGSFESLARQVSAATSAEQGGDLGWVRSTVIPADLLVALEQLQPGEVSAPLRSPVGYHVFWLRDRRLAAPQLAPADAQVEVSLSQILFPFDQAEGQAGVPRLREEALACARSWRLRPRTDRRRASAARLGRSAGSDRRAAADFVRPSRAANRAGERASARTRRRI